MEDEDTLRVEVAPKIVITISRYAVPVSYTHLGIYQVDFFTDTKKLEKEKKLQQAMLGDVYKRQAV